MDFRREVFSIDRTNHCITFRLILRLLIAVILGALVGYVSLTHFFYVREASMMAAIIGISTFLFLLFSTMHNRDTMFHRGLRPYLLPILISDAILLASSILKIALIENRNTLHGIIFGIVIASLSYLLMISSDFFCHLHRARSADTESAEEE